MIKKNLLILATAILQDEATQVANQLCFCIVPSIYEETLKIQSFDKQVYIA